MHILMEKFIGTVRDISLNGLGVVDHPHTQKVYFARGAWPGDLAQFLCEKNQEEYTEVKLIELVEKSPHRQNPPCPHQGYQLGECGGCPWMIAEYSSQLKYKVKILLHNMKRHGLIQNMEDPRVLPAIPSSHSLGYRNRAQFKTNGEVIGFISAKSRQIAPIQDCLVLTSKNRETLRELLQQLPQKAWKPNPGYPWSYLEIDESIKTSEVLPNKRRPFQQANSEQNAKIKTWLKDKMQDLPREYQVLELFCGDGNITEILDGLGFKKIIAAECVEIAIESLNKKKLSQVQAISLDLYRPSAWNILKKHIPFPEVIVLDPPRAGFEKIRQFLRVIRGTQYIYYISCDVTSFCEDARSLEKAGYKLLEVQPIDQFPQTSHIELLAYFEKVNISRPLAKE